MKLLHCDISGIILYSDYIIKFYTQLNSKQKNKTQNFSYFFYIFNYYKNIWVSLMTSLYFIFYIPLLKYILLKLLNVIILLQFSWLMNLLVHIAHISKKDLIIDKLILNCYLLDNSLYLNSTDDSIVSISMIDH